MTLEQFKKDNNLTLKELSNKTNYSMSCISKMVNGQLTSTKTINNFKEKIKQIYNIEIEINEKISLKYKTLVQENNELKQENKYLKTIINKLNYNLNTLKILINDIETFKKTEIRKRTRHKTKIKNNLLIENKKD